MTREEALNKTINILSYFEAHFAKSKEAREDVINIIEALEQESPWDDTISRQQVRSEYADWYGYGYQDNWFYKRLGSMPSVAIPSAEPNTGHWEWVQYDSNPNIGNWHCSECRCVVVECVKKNEKGGIPLYKYCPNCGARMVEPQESEDKK